MVGLDGGAVGRFEHLHRCVAGHETDHHALVRWIEMKDQNEGHAGVCRQRIDKFVKGF